MADADIEKDVGTPRPPERPGILPLVGTLILVTLFGGGAGMTISGWQVERANQIATQRANAEPITNEQALAWTEDTSISRLEPVITNLANPSEVWVRLDTAVVFNQGAVSDVERMKAEVSQSILSFLRTLSIDEIEGASAFNHLRDDLNDRVRMASSGTVDELIIETMVLQ